MRDRLAEFEKRNAAVLAVDPHEPWSARYLVKDSGLETSDLHFPLLCDPAQVVSATYGVAFQMRIHTEWSNRPATFVIDRQGVIRYERRATTYADRPKVPELLAELDKLE